MSQNAAAERRILRKEEVRSTDVRRGPHDDHFRSQPPDPMKPPINSDADSSQLRQALSKFATGVTIVTSVGRDLEPVGITANSFSSVSLEPPMVLWSLSDKAFSRQAFESAGHFCVHVLAAEQQDLSEQFARAGEDKFSGLEWSRGLGHVPLLSNFVARFQCRNLKRHPAGDHIIFIGEVLEYEQNENRPLVFQGGRYALAERRMMASVARDVGERRAGWRGRWPAERKRYAD